jgi:FtsP/CotA-like multicopper oxidase with cupredoxin domain
MISRKILHLLVLVAMLGSLVLFSGVSPVSAQNRQNPPVGQPNSKDMPMSPTDETKVPHYFGPWPNWANSPFTLPDINVTINPGPDGLGTGAAASATVGANGAITGITITSPGSGYTSATAQITGAGTGATAVVTVTSSGAVTAIITDTAGGGYTTPVVNIAASTQVTATATAYGSIDALTLTNPGSGYTMPTVDFDFPDDPNGVIARAHVVCAEANCQPTTAGGTVTITGIALDNPGSGYSKAPNVVIREGSQFARTNTRIENAAKAARAQALKEPQAGPVSPQALHAAAPALTNANATATLAIRYVTVDNFGSGYMTVPGVTIADATGSGNGATAHAVTDLGAVTAISITNPGSGYITPGIKKFQDGLPMLCDPSVARNCDAVKTNLGQYMPLAVPDTGTFSVQNGYNPGADYYVIALVQHREQMNSSLPPVVTATLGTTPDGTPIVGHTSGGTLLREYVQLETTANASWSKHVPLTNDLLNGSTPVRMPDGSQAYAVDNPHYMGPIISATKDKPIRIVFYNLLPTGSDGDLFIPVDTTFMGAGMGPMNMMMPPMDQQSVMDEIRNPMCGETDKNRMGCYADTRASIHLHGGITPWISDGSPHQWVTPANEQTGWPEGVAVRQVPDMVGGKQPAGVPDCSADTDGCTTFYYTNQQSARLMFYHDHAWGITRLNVYAGEAAGYLISDPTEQKLISGGIIPGGADEIPLVIQERTFVPGPAQMKATDPTWDYTRWGSEGNLWYEHVYMPAQNPSDPSGLSTVGRWFYGPWFWPPTSPTYGEIDNPYFGKDPKGPDGLRGTADDWTSALPKPCSLDDPTSWQYDTDPFCESPKIPGTPNNSAGMEQFNDTPVVNGAAYPTITLEPKAYRFRMLNAANDRFFNFQWYVGDPNTASTSSNGAGAVIGPTEVALNPAELAAAQNDPNMFPTPILSTVDQATGQIVDLTGPDWIQIGTEGGFLPAPVVVDGQQPTTWIIDPTRFDVGNVDLHSLVLGPAERADVIVDFSKFAGKTLILYNDAPAAYPARISSYDYYTGAPDMSPNGAPAILPGYGPNTRTVMQVKIAGTPTPAFNLTALQNAFKHHADGSGVFESGQNPTIVGQAGYNSAYGKSFASGSWCNDPSGQIGPCDGFARISEQGGDIFKFDTLKGPQIGVKIEPKALHDEMNSTNFEPYGRMSGNIGVEVVPADPNTQNVVLYPFVNPPTEMFDGTNLPESDTIKPIAVGTDGTEIWKLTHNGVDTHPLHFHLYDVQLLNRVTWDNIIIPPDPTELGWKDTVRTSPLEDTYFAIRPVIPKLPWELPNSIRPLNPMMPAGDTSMFNNVDPAGNAPATAITNTLVNFGWEYMVHCHILSHEEMDMMRPVSVAMPPKAPDGVSGSVSGSGNNTRLTLTWNDNSINETSFVVQKTDDGTNWVELGTVSSPLSQPNTHGTRNYVDRTYRSGMGRGYRVVAENTIGYGNGFPGMTAQSMSTPWIIGNPPAAPTTLTAALQAGPRVQLTWRDNATNEGGFIIERSINGGAFVQVGIAPARTNTGSQSWADTAITAGATVTTYAYRVAAVNGAGQSGYSNTASVVVPAMPAAPTNVGATAVTAQQGLCRANNRAVAGVRVTWTDNSNNETGFTLQRGTLSNGVYSWSPTTPGTVAANATSGCDTGAKRGTTYYYRVLANNGTIIYSASGPSNSVVAP